MRGEKVSHKKKGKTEKGNWESRSRTDTTEAKEARVWMTKGALNEPIR